VFANARYTVLRRSAAWQEKMVYLWGNVLG